MATAESHQLKKSTTSAAESTAALRIGAIRSSFFRYYIHDKIDEFRMQLIGPLSDPESAELAACWQTARSTLGARRLLLDLRRVTATNDSATQWIISMVNEGAILEPESFLRSSRNGANEEHSTLAKAKMAWTARLWAFFRGNRVIPTQAQ